MATRYQILVAGPLSAATRDAFAGLDVSSDRATTVISGDLDQAALYGLLQQVRRLGLELVAVRRIGPRPRRASI